jgi:hypothetical protein
MKETPTLEATKTKKPGRKPLPHAHISLYLISEGKEMLSGYTFMNLLLDTMPD